MRIPAGAVFLCAVAGAVSYINSDSGGGAVVIAGITALAALGAAIAARRRGDAIERNVTEFARTLLSKQFARYDPLSHGGESEMAKALNTAAREFQKRVRAGDEQRARLSVFLNQIREGVLCVSAQGRVTAANKSAQTMLGASGEMVGRNYWEVILSPEIRGLIKDALESGDEPLRREVANLYPAENFYVASAARGEGNDEVTLVLFDSTEMKKLEKAQRDFITNASHEIRTPLTSIMGAVERITGGADGETEKFAQILERNTGRLAKLCGRIISLSELEERRGGRESFLPFNLNDAVMSAVDLMSAAAERKNIAIETEEEPDIVINGDRLIIENMFVNLIENAVKYSPGGSRVRVSVSGGAGGARVSVSDSGRGIERGEEGRIFERFYRGKSAIAEAGNGLGLSIAREAVEIHGGAITVESKPGSGSVFTVSFGAKT
ncbi:MAG: PAS domain-containing protein [Candidatus Mycalebacterium zealandia]|nr:MAG: PAS domain-containing protein [Candidatus Mycalebacterium zealandia]